MRITMIGTGYVGLVSGACFADFGHEVVCVDKDPAKIDALVERGARAGRLGFTTDTAAGVADADAIFIAVGTPSRRGDGHADLTYVHAAVREVAAAAKPHAVIVTKSTVPVGTGDAVERIVAEVAPDKGLTVGSNPEFLREGAAIEDFKRPDRVVCGVEGDRAREVLAAIYRPLSLNQSSPVLFTRRRTAELIKYAANAFLATKITFINEIADLCEAAGADVQDVAKGIGMDNRIGRKFLHAGPGYGGSCFPKDTLALLQTAEQHETPLRIVEAVVSVNDHRKRAMGRKVTKALGGVHGKTVALLGLTFKPNTDDMRDAPSIAIVQHLQDCGAAIRACDPEGVEQARRLFEGVDYVSDPYAAADGADAVVIVTEWDAFRALDLARIARSMRNPLLVDLRNVYSAADAAAAGLEYVAVGKGEAAATVSA